MESGICDRIPPDIEGIARRFLRECSFAEDIEAAFLAGSYAVGNADAFSDIDLYIVLRDVPWRERGNVRIDGMLVEYFANPAAQIHAYIESALKNGGMSSLLMTLKGIPLIDKNGCAEQLLEYCRRKREEGIAPLGAYDLAVGKYRLWDMYDELGRARMLRTPDYLLQCQNLFLKTVEVYCRFLQYPQLPPIKLYRILSDADFCAGYGVPAFPDREFAALAVAFVEANDAEMMYSLLGRLHAQVLEAMGGFDIDTFTLRSKCDLG